jgi:hypothetical protein
VREFLLSPPAGAADVGATDGRDGLRAGVRTAAEGRDGLRAGVRTAAASITAWPPFDVAASRSVRAASPGRRGVPAALADLFVHRPEAAAAVGATDVTTVFTADLSVSALAVLCAAEDARAVGVAVAGLLARQARAACAVACVWTAPEAHRHPEARPPAARAARRLAGTLSARGLDAFPCGRAAVVALPADPAHAVAAAGRAAAAGGAAPAVLVLGGPRAAAFDDLLTAQDRVLVVTRPDAADAIAALAAAGLPPAGPPHERCALALGPVGRALAASGLATPAALRRALASGGVATPASARRAHQPREDDRR